MQRRLFMMVVLGLVMCTGCIETDYKLVLNKDGSGHLKGNIVVDSQVANNLHKVDQGMPQLNTMPPVVTSVPRTLGEKEGIDVSDISVKQADNGNKDISFSVHFDSIKKFAEVAGPRILPFEMKRRSEGAVEFNLVGPWTKRLGYLAKVKPERLQAQLAMHRLQLRDAKYQLEVVFPGKVKKAAGGKAEENKAVWSFQAEDLTVDNLVDENGDLIVPSAVFEGKDVAFNLPIRVKQKEAHPARQKKKREESWEEVPLVEREDDSEQNLFEIMPGRFKYSKRFNRWHGGNVRRRGKSVFKLRVTCGKNVNPLSYARLSVEKAISGEGDVLLAPAKLGKHQRERKVARRHGHPYKQNRFLVDVPLASDVADVSSIRRLKGAFEMKYASNVRKVRINPIKKWVGKKIDTEKMGDLEVYLKGHTSNSLTLRYPPEIRKRIKQVKFMDETGEALQTRGRSGRGGTDYYTQTHRVSVPEGGTVLLHVYDDIKRKELSFDLENISVTTSDTQSAPMAEKGRFEVSVSEVRASKKVDFARGHPQKERTRGSIGLSVVCPQEVYPITSRIIRIKKAVSDEGDRLALAPRLRSHRHLRHRIHSARSATSDKKIKCSLKLRRDPEKVMSIARLDGSLRLKYATDIKKAEIDPVSEWINKPLQVSGMEDVEILVSEVGSDKTTIRFSKNTKELLKDVKFIDAEGQELRSHGGLRRSRGGSGASEYRVSLPEEGAILFHLYSGIKEKRIPFSVTDFDLKSGK